MRLNARRASFSALANVAASPSIASKSQSRQRQLISGRDFNDILEACRPRNSQHSVPSALSSLLRMHELMQEEPGKTLVDAQVAGKEAGIDVPQNETTTPSHQNALAQPGSSQLKEWGAIDFDEVAAIFGQSSATMKHSMLGSDSPHARDQMSERSSSPSSFSSQLSSLLGRSLERSTPLHTLASGFRFHSRRMADGIQMQRCPSMDSLDLADEEERTVSMGKRSDESLHELGAQGSRIEGKGFANESTASADKKESQESDAEYLRKLMQQQDEHFFPQNRVKAVDQKVQPGAIRSGEGPVGSSGSIIPSLQ